MRTFFIVLSLVVVTAVSAFAKALPVTVSIAPQKYFVEKIGGPLVDVSIMVRAGASPATYEPRPSQMAELANARLYFSIGVPFERGWLPRIQSANKDMRIIPMHAGIPLMPMAAHYHEHEEHGDQDKHETHAEEKILDPHVWTSPKLALLLAENTLQALKNADPNNAATFEANHKSLVAEIKALDAELTTQFAAIPPKTPFMVYHPSWGYFAKNYGLRQIPVELEGKAPGPRELVELVKLARAENIRVLFVQPQFSERSARIIADEINGNVVKADPLAEDWANNLRSVSQAIIEAVHQ